jgi:hypothetical protein
MRSAKTELLHGNRRFGFDWFDRSLPNRNERLMDATNKFRQLIQGDSIGRYMGRHDLGSQVNNSIFHLGHLPFNIASIQRC